MIFVLIFDCIVNIPERKIQVRIEVFIPELTTEIISCFVLYE